MAKANSYHISYPIIYHIGFSPDGEMLLLDSIF